MVLLLLLLDCIPPLLMLLDRRKSSDELLRVLTELLDDVKDVTETSSKAQFALMFIMLRLSQDAFFVRFKSSSMLLFTLPLLRLLRGALPPGEDTTEALLSSCWSSLRLLDRDIFVGFIKNAGDVERLEELGSPALPSALILLFN